MRQRECWKLYSKYSTRPCFAPKLRRMWKEISWSKRGIRWLRIVRELLPHDFPSTVLLIQPEAPERAMASVNSHRPVVLAGDQLLAIGRKGDGGYRRTLRADLG